MSYGVEPYAAIADETQQPPLAEQHVNAVFAVLGKQDHEAQCHQNRSDPRLEVVAAVQKTVPRPQMLRQGAGQYRDRRYHQKKSRDLYKNLGRASQRIQVSSVLGGTVLQTYRLLGFQAAQFGSKQEVRLASDLKRSAS